MLDLSNPAAPLLSAPLPVPSPASLAADGARLIVGDTQAITLYDAASPADLQPGGTIPLSTAALSAYANGHLYALKYGGAFLTAVDIRRPAAPQLHQLALPEKTTRSSSVIVASGNYLLVGGRGESWRLFDLADPIRPQLLSEIPLPLDSTSGSAVLDMTSSSPTAYLLRSCSGSCPPYWLDIYDLADPARPHVLSRIPLGERWATALASHEGYVYIVYREPDLQPPPAVGGWLQVIDVRDRAAPRAMGKAPFSGEAMDLAAADERAYVATWSGGLHTFAVDDPANPHLLSTYQSDPEMHAGAVAVDGPAVFIATRNTSQLHALDLSDPTSPRLVAQSQLPGTSDELLLLGDQLVTSGRGGIAVYQRGSAPASVVRDARGAPMPDVTLELGAGLAQLTSGLQAQATDLGGSLSIDPASSAGALLTPSFRDAAFWPERRTVAEGAALDFTLLAPPVTAAVVPGEAATLVLTDTQGLTSSLSLPPGALSAPATLTLRPLVVGDAWPLRFAGQGFALSLADAGARFVEPAELTLRYSRADARLISQRSELGLYRRGEGGWAPVEQGCPGAAAPAHDQQARELRVSICAPGEYALLGPSERILLPLLRR